MNLGEIVELSEGLAYMLVKTEGDNENSKYNYINIRSGKNLFIEPTNSIEKAIEKMYQWIDGVDKIKSLIG